MVVVLVLAAIPIRADWMPQGDSVTDARLFVLDDGSAPVQLEGVAIVRNANGTPAAVRLMFRSRVAEPLRAVKIDALLFDSRNRIRLLSRGIANRAALSVASGTMTISVNRLDAKPDWKVVVGVAEVSFGSRQWAAAELRAKAEATLKPPASQPLADGALPSDAPDPAADAGQETRKETKSGDGQMPSNRSVWDGVYTNVQGERGQRLYTTHCSTCHGTNLLADAAEQIGRDDEQIARGAMRRTPPLLGPAFLERWNGLTVGDLSERTRISMPQQAPGSLGSQQVADIVAYLLQQNGFPSGDIELPRERDLLQIAIAK